MAHIEPLEETGCFLAACFATTSNAFVLPPTAVAKLLAEAILDALLVHVFGTVMTDVAKQTDRWHLAALPGLLRCQIGMISPIELPTFLSG